MDLRLIMVSMIGLLIKFSLCGRCIGYSTCKSRQLSPDFDVPIPVGRAARLAVGNENVSIEAAVTGIIDEYEIQAEHYSGDLDPNRIVYKKTLGV